jgi:hypothetical protein
MSTNITVAVKDIEQLCRISERPVWEGNLISKTSRDRLREEALVEYDEHARDPDPHVQEVGAWVLTSRGETALRNIHTLANKHCSVISEELANGHEVSSCVEYWGADVDEWCDKCRTAVGVVIIFEVASSKG